MEPVDLTLPLFPFCPIPSERRDVYDWNTDIHGFWDTEYRVALRDYPRLTSRYTYHLTRAEFGTFRMLTKQAYYGLGLFPVWSERAFATDPVEIDDITGYSDEVMVDTRLSGFVQGQAGIIWYSSSDYYLFIVEEVHEDRIVFQSELEIDATFAEKKPVVAPVMEGYLDGTSNARFRNGAFSPRATVEYTSKQFRDIDVTRLLGTNQYKDFNEYRDLLVLPRDAVDMKESRNTFTRSRDIFDTPQGIIDVTSDKNYNEDEFVIVIETMGDRERMNYLLWLYSVVGQQKAFWIPSMNYDFRLSAPMPTTNMVSIRTPIQASEFVGKHLYFDVRNGPTYYAKIAEATDEQGGVQLELEDGLPMTLHSGNVAIIGLLEPYRLSTDTVQLNYRDIKKCRIAVTCVRVPDAGI